MSLVHQALRKAEQEKLRRTGIVAPQPLLPPSPPPPPRPVVAPARVPEPVAAAPVTAGPARPSAALVPVLVSCVAFVAIVATVVIVVRSASPPPSGTVAPRAAGPSAHPATVTELPQADGPPAAATEATPASPAVDAERYQLSGIAQAPDGRPTAFVNGQLRYEGQFIDGATVQKIERDRVTLVVKGRTIVKRLF